MSMTLVIPKGANTLTCKTCQQQCTSTANGECHPCAAISQAAWTKKMAIRQDPAQFNLDKLVRLLLTEHWMHECKITVDYMPPFPSKDTRPMVQVSYTYPDGEESCLRYGRGPMQGYFWDVYGSDMHSAEMALVAISQAPAPPQIGVVIPTHGN